MLDLQMKDFVGTGWRQNGTMMKIDRQPNRLNDNSRPKNLKNNNIGTIFGVRDFSRVVIDRSSQTRLLIRFI